jgi:hypothetical protein
MNKEVAIDQVYIAVSGGHLTDDASVKKADIAPYLNAVINYVQYQSIRERIEVKRKTKMIEVFEEISTILDSDLYCKFVVTPQKDETRDEHFVVLPKKLENLPNNSGLRHVAPLAGYMPYIHQSSRFAVSGAEEVFAHITSYYYEKTEDKEYVYIRNIGYPIGDVEVHMSVGVDGLSDTAELPIPKGYEKQVIDLTVQFFMGQKQGFKDYFIDNTELKPSEVREHR